MTRWTLALLAATHAFQPHAPVQRLRPLRVEVFDEATLLIEQAVEWSRDEHPFAEPCVCETAEPIVTSTIFWSVVNDACQFPAKEATIIFDKDDFPVDEWADMVSSLGIDGLTCEVEDEAPLPCVKISVDWSPEDAGFVSDEMADASVESLKTWVQDVIVDSKVCPFTRSAEVAATGLENQGVEKGPIMYPVCGAVGSGGAALVRVLRAFWGSSIDMLSQPPSQASTVLLSVPAYAERDHDAFVDMTQVVVKTLKHVGAEHQLSLVFFHPEYERSVIEPVDSFTHGHLPPQKWLRAYVRLTEGEEVATGLSEAQLKHADYQRRAPFTMINILRSEQVEAAEAVVPWEVIEPEPDRRVRVSGARVYAKNIWRFATDASERTVDGYKYLVTGGKAGKGPAVGVS